MHCADVTERLLAAEGERDSDVEQHVADCAQCLPIAQGLVRVDGILSAALVIAPPLDLQRQLAQLALDAARPAARPWWSRLQELLGQLDPANWALAQKPQMIAAQGLAAVMLALASWQIFGWLTAFQPVVGDVGYAMALVVGSPAITNLGGLQIDLQSLGLWSVIGLGGWLISENGLIGSRLASRLRLP